MLPEGLKSLLIGWALLIHCTLAFPYMMFSTRRSGDALSSQLAAQAARASWVERVEELVDYQEEHGDTLVPKRYSENPSLGNWVNKQRQLYRKYHSNETPCSLTAEKVEILNGMGFCWNGATSKQNTVHENSWWKRYEEIQAIGSFDRRLSSSTLAIWVRQQRKEFHKFQGGETSTLDSEKRSLLDAIDPIWWKSPRERQWDTRCKELKQYHSEFGDCCVPITYKNRKLANWVSRNRKNYKLKMAGEASRPSDRQIDQLDSLGFVWDRWDYEYERKLNETINRWRS